MYVLDGKIFQEHCSETAFKCHLVGAEAACQQQMPNQLTGPGLFFREPSQSWTPLGTRQRQTLRWDGTAWEAERGWVCSGANKEESGPGVPYRFFQVFLLLELARPQGCLLPRIPLYFSKLFQG